ncbi:MAG: phosphatidylglycerophosphatase A [Moritella sp.]|jgi:phosphatidylglycerophosphatase A
MKTDFLSPELKKLNLANPVHLAAVGFGSGLSPKAPGTMGTLAAIPLYLLLTSVLQLGLWQYIGVVALASVVGVYFCASASKAMGVHDHGAIVWDEIAGYGITMIAAPQGWFWILLGFGLFRFFDIVKPGPIGWLDKNTEGGFGIMIDDVLAGFFAFLSLQLIGYIYL